MNYYLIKPEVAGGYGDDTVCDTRPIVVHKLHYEFFGWMGDDLITSFPSFIASDRLVRLILENHLTGTAIADVKVTFSREYFSSFKKAEVPFFHWLKIEGTAGSEDFGYSPKRRLVVSEKALEVLRKVNIHQADIEPYNP